MCPKCTGCQLDSTPDTPHEMLIHHQLKGAKQRFRVVIVTQPGWVRVRIVTQPGWVRVTIGFVSRLIC